MIAYLLKSFDIHLINVNSFVNEKNTGIGEHNAANFSILKSKCLLFNQQKVFLLEALQQGVCTSWGKHYLQNFS